MRLCGPDGGIDIYALVDSGSDDTIFDHELADAVGIDWSSGKFYDITGVSGGKVAVHFKSAVYEISGHKIVPSSPLGFTSLPQGYKALLGQTGFFDSAIVSLDHSNNRIEIRL